MNSRGCGRRRRPPRKSRGTSTLAHGSIVWGSHDRTPRTAQARATSAIEPSGPTGSRAWTASRTVTAGRRDRCEVPGCRALAAEERAPVVVEVAEHRGDLDRARRHRGETRPSEERGEPVGVPAGESPTIIAVGNGGIEGDGPGPEVPHHLHPPA